jgi:hypothetical protein
VDSFNQELIASARAFRDFTQKFADTHARTPSDGELSGRAMTDLATEARILINRHTETVDEAVRRG